MTETIVEDPKAASRLARVRKMLERAEAIEAMDESALTEELRTEARTINERAAELIAQYGIDRAMLAADGSFGDEVIDQVIMLSRPFAAKMMDLLWTIAYNLRGQGRLIKSWNPESGPKARGGVPRGGWDYGLRLFAYRSDMERIELMYASLRLQALSGARKIVNTSSQFGQGQKADRESYLDGFSDAIGTRIRRAEDDARRAQEARDRELADQAMIEGRTAGAGVALVLADRKTAVQNAMDAASGITPAMKARWARQSEEAAAARRKEIAVCQRCQKAKSGRCNDHRIVLGRAPKIYTRKGDRYYDGYEDGQRADLGTGKAVSAKGRKEIGS